MEQLFQKNIPINIEDEMKKSYMDYAMSVIIGRAIPDVRDGMKPVHRRVLFAMSEMGNVWNKAYKKSARIVGDIIGKYHPHGDTAAYDTLVRMAQDFSMRYPLIDGQGNFGCFTGDTKIKLLDGTERSFEELSRLKPDEVFNVYSVNGDGRIVVGEGRNARVTRRNAQLVELALDSGDTIRCTPDHRFMLRDGSYKEARQITPADSLMPGYFDSVPVKEGLNDYLRILQPSTGEYEFVHHLADELNLLKGKALKFNGPYVRHHRNFNRWDNRPENIRRMTFLEHLHLHANRISSLWEDETFRKRQSEGVKKYYDSNPTVRQERRRQIIEQNKSETFRNSQGVRLSPVLKKFYQDNPDKRAQISRQKKALWEDSRYRHKMRLALQGIQKRELSPQEKANVAKIISEKSRAMWGDEGKRAEIVEAINLAMASPGVRAKISRAVRRAWQEPSYRAKFPKEHFSRMARACWEQPETKIIHREKRLSQQTDPVFRVAQRVGVQRSNVRRMMENPKIMAELAEKAAQALTAKWTDARYKRQVIRSKVARYVSRLFVEMPGETITPQIYEERRRANWIPRLQTALSYFDTFDEILDSAVNYNHRIVGIRWLDKRADTYDIEVDEHHNFLLASGVFVHNSVDGDPPAAMRYTEIRMARLAEEMLADIEKETVDFVPNYDATMQEPTVLPARMPALLLNGTSGIAVGVATNIPPHNLGELVDGTIALIRDPEITINGLMVHIKGPDFPTAGFINGRDGIVSAYTTGRGSIRMRARASIERNARNDRESIVVTELPYLVNKANLIEKISELVKEKKMEGISDLRDESDRDGIRIVIDLKKDEPSGVILNQLYKHTHMGTSFGVIMLAIDRNQPKVLNLKEILQKFVDFRKEVITRRTIFDLRKAKERAHILEGLIIALNNIDAVVQLIKKSKNPQEAAQALTERFGLSEIQARAILDMRLQRLTGLERTKIDDEYAELTRLIAQLQGILDDPKKVLDIIVAELEEIRKKYGDERRTEIVESVEDIDIEDMIVEEDMVVTVSHYGYIKRNAVSLYRSQRRGGKGKVGMGTKEEDFVEKIFIASTHHYILIFTNLGRVYWLKVYQIPQAGRASKGKAIVNLVNLSPGERVAAILPVREFVEGKYVIMVTRKGITKKTDLAAYSNPRSGGIIAISIDEGDELIAVQLTHGDQDVFLGTRKGQSILFHEEDVRDMGRTARGVIGIRMDDDDAVVGMEIPSEGNSIITVSENGYGKRTEVEEYRRQSRGGQGVINLKTVSKVGNVSGVLQVTGDEDIMLISNAGKIIRLKVAEVPLLHRSTQGVRLIEIDPEEKLVGVARAERESEDKDNGLLQEDVEEETVNELELPAGDEEEE